MFKIQWQTKNDENKNTSYLITLHPLSLLVHIRSFVQKSIPI